MILRLIHKFKVLIRPLLVISLMSVCAQAGAQTAHSVDSLNAELAKATTPADSVSILHNLYDCFYFNDRKPVLYQIYETAERAKDYRSMLETLFVLTALYQYEPELEEELVEMAKRVPASEIQRAHLLYIKLRYQTTNFNRMSEKERQQKLHQALKDYREHNRLDKYDRIACLFLICTNLRNTTDSELLVSYLQQLQDLIEEFPYEELPVRTLFYSLAINTYIDNGMYDKALAANKRMLELVAQFDKLHESQGRIFRNYDGSLYQCYHNMLVCAQELTDEEIDMYYDKIRHLIATNPRIYGDLDMQKRTRVYYFMAKKRYAEALPMLKEQLRIFNNHAQYAHFALLYVKAAREVGDKEALLYGSKIINSIYRNRLMAKSDISLSELQTIYDVESLKDKNRDLTFENQQMEIARRHQGIVAVTVAALILLCILIWMIRLYIHSRRLAKRLSSSNKKLVEERNTLQDIYSKLVSVRDKAEAADRIKSDFVENMSGEIRVPLGAIVEYSRLISGYAEGDSRPYIRGYADAMSVNTDLLIRLVNDVLDLPQIESGELSIHRAPSSVNGICNFSLEIVKKHVAPGVELIFANAGQPDTTILTDSQRVEQVLIQLLTNAAKFTESGSITLGYEVSRQSDTITFEITDTGIGVPRGMEEKIFDRFVKAASNTQGNGLGLYIGRLLANMLGGTLSLDSYYRAGARFIFTIPIA
ncbi:MAG: HAMP domain-containing histidine kinase [Paramuribaculum sp.]|nr:HAMP domain-containing histidine kinase [Paramuribaculum sp.]